jgi:hypothetical protein
MERESMAFELLKEEYTSLRAEICQSITYQHQILLGGYAASGALFGYIATAQEPLWTALAALPFAFLAMASLWIVEYNRMVRAGHYIAYFLWPQWKDAAGCKEDPRFKTEWEIWVRMKAGIAESFGKTQHQQQRMVVIVVPLLASVLSAAIAVYTSWQRRREVHGLQVLAVLVVIVTALILWTMLSVKFEKISKLSADQPE